MPFVLLLLMTSNMKISMIDELTETVERTSVPGLQVDDKKTPSMEEW
jgi:hypothetical protein